VLASLLKAGTALSSSSSGDSGGSSGSSGGSSNGGSSNGGGKDVVVAAGVTAKWGQLVEQTAEECRVAVAAALVALLVPSILKSDTSTSSGGEGTSSSSSHDGSSGGSSDSIGRKWEAVCAVGLAPWLVLYGRCCLQWGQQLLSLMLLPQGTRHRPFPLQQAGLLKEYDIDSSLSVVFDPRYKIQQLGLLDPEDMPGQQGALGEVGFRG
jgi:hypothetical protein